MAHQAKASKKSEEENEACGDGGRAQNRLEGGPEPTACWRGRLQPLLLVAVGHVGGS